METFEELRQEANPDQAGPEPLLAQYLQLVDQITDHIAPIESRRLHVADQIATTRSYDLSLEELTHGAKLAWRNHARCNGRMHWRALHLLDFRAAETPKEIFEGCMQHLDYSTNGGALRAVISVFPQARASGSFEVLNPQLIRYAAHRQPDGSILGDPLNARITEIAVAKGWKPQVTQFDILPLLIKAPDGRISIHEIDPEHVLEVEIYHPDYPGIGELGLKWHANPAISDKVLSLGGLEFMLAPFSGWYISSEIGARNFSDESRYNVLPEVARAMGLDTRKDSTFWKDRAVVELTAAVHWSYVRSNVHIVDHHTASRQFIRHIERESDNNRKTPTDWCWINPPISASTTPTFHRQYDPADFDVRPNFVQKPSSATPPTCIHA